MQDMMQYQVPEMIWVGSAIDLTQGGNTPLADKPGDPSGGYNRGYGFPEADEIDA